MVWRLGGAVVFGVVWVTLGARSVEAQYPTYPLTGLSQEERFQVEADRLNPGNSHGANSYLDETLAAPRGIGSNPNLWCPQGQGQCNEGVAAPTPAPINRTTTVNTFSPMTGFGATMSSMAYTNQAASMLVSPLSVLKIAWGLTEPAIAAGSDAAMAQGNMWLQNRYLSDEAFVRHAKMNPHSEVILQTYRDCISKAMGAAAPGLIGPMPTGMSWVEAVSKCQGGDSTSGGTTTPFAATDDNGFTFAENFAWEADGFGLNQDSEISALDLLFNPADPSGSQAAVRESFLNLVGDVRFAIGNGSSGARQLNSTRVPPVVPPEETYKELTLEAYHSLHELMRHHCRFKFYGQLPGGGTGTSTAHVYQFYTSTALRNLRERLSVKGYDLGQRGADGLFKLFLRQYVAGTAQPNCDVLQSWQNGNSTSLASLATNWSSRTTEMTRVYFAFARGIAMARYLGALQRAESAVLKLSGGEFESAARRGMLEAIYEVASTADLGGALATNLEFLRTLEARVIRANEVSGKDFGPEKLG